MISVYIPNCNFKLDTLLSKERLDTHGYVL